MTWQSLSACTADSLEIAQAQLGLPPSPNPQPTDSLPFPRLSGTFSWRPMSIGYDDVAKLCDVAQETHCAFPARDDACEQVPRVFSVTAQNLLAYDGGSAALQTRS